MAKSVYLKDSLLSGKMNASLADIYADEGLVQSQIERYAAAIDRYVSLYGDGDLTIYSAPGRSEVLGNHTDHQHGEVVAASINLDAIAVVEKTEDGKVRLVSEDSEEIIVDVSDISKKADEEGTTLSLVKGVLSGAKNHGFKIGGFKTYITSDVLIGAGLSSSAAFEILIGTIISYLYNDGKIDAITNAIIGQYAENVYFGKPCGLMDQMACSVGNMVNIDFKDPENPVVKKIDFDLNKYGYSLCITDTKGSHADLTADYAAVPYEMKKVAEFFGKDVLEGLTLDDLTKNMQELRKLTGDRAVLRAIHFICENDRVKQAVKDLDKDDVDKFLDAVKASGNSSFKYLQNVYSNSNVQIQNVSIALAISETILGENGVCRVHGGGFAGTIQAFAKNDAVSDYQKKMNDIFGENACKVLKIRKYGGIKVTND